MAATKKLRIQGLYFEKSQNSYVNIKESSSNIQFKNYSHKV